MRVESKYEVICPSCRVSYPPEQKQCIHCGGRTTKSIVEIPDAPPEFTQGMGRVEREPMPMRAGEDRELVFMPADAGDEELDETRGGMLRRLGGLTWIILFVILTAIRMCSEGGE